MVPMQRFGSLGEPAVVGGSGVAIRRVEALRAGPSMRRFASNEGTSYARPPSSRKLARGALNNVDRRSRLKASVCNGRAT